MRYVYLDESVSADGSFAGYGALTADDQSPEQVVDAALSALKADPDRYDSRCCKQDDQTIWKGFFHASDDSKNSHSHFCTELNKLQDGEFTSHIFDTRNTRLRNPSREHLFDLTTGLSSLPVFQMRDPVTIVFEKRKGLSRERVEKWLNRYTNQVLASIYNQPYIPTLFPEVRITIADKKNHGLQCCDFLLWTVMRKLQGDSTWYDRLHPPYKIEARLDLENNEVLSSDMDFGEILHRGEVHYESRHFPLNPDAIMSENNLIQFYIYAERVISYFARNALPSHLNYLDDEVKRLARTCFDQQEKERIVKMATVYLKLFDTLPLLTSNCRQDERELLLLSKKYMALVLRSDLIHGMRTRIYLEKIRRNILSDNPNMLTKS